MTLEQRVAKLERSVKLWRLVGVVGLLLVVGMGADAESVPKVIRANSFVVEDRDGNVRGIFGFLTEDGENVLTMIGKDGKSGFAAQPGISKLKVTSADGSVRMIE